MSKNKQQEIENKQQEIELKTPLDKVSASIKSEYEITRFQKENCYVYACWEWSKPQGDQAGKQIRKRNISFGSAQEARLKGKNTCSPEEYLKGVYGSNFKLINEPTKSK